MIIPDIVENKKNVPNHQPVYTVYIINHQVIY